MTEIYTLIENSPSLLSPIFQEKKQNQIYLDGLKIGVFDSGIGGLSFVKELKKYPLKSIFYFADTAYLPYGDKSVELLLERAKIIVSMMNKKGIRHIVIACHTTTTTTLPKLKKLFPQTTFIHLLNESIGGALLETKNKKIGVWATRRTIGTHIHKKRLKKHANVQVFEKACPLLVPLIESSASEEDLQKAVTCYLAPLLKKGIDTLILGCTHYVWIKKHIQMLAPNLTIISADQYVGSLFKKKNSETPSIKISSSKDTEAINLWAQKLL